MRPIPLPQPWSLPLTAHARLRCAGRSISLAAVEATLAYGRCRARRGAEVFTLGWREVARLHGAGLDLTRFEGTEVVCSHRGEILTVYRKHRRHYRRERGADHRRERF